MKPVVSIVIPVYNLEKYIQKCLDSVSNQTFTKYEVIIVDDGSTDNTSKVIAPYLRDPRFTLIRTPNRGVSSARNFGLAIVRGKYIVFLDGDDYWDKSFLEKSIRTLEKNKTDVCYSGFRVVDEYGNVIKVQKNPHVKNPLLHFLKGDIWIQISGVVVRKKVLEKYDLKFREGCHHGQDMEFLYKLLAISTVSSTEEILYSYLKRHHSLSSGFKLKHLHAYGAHIRALRFIQEKMRGSEAKNVVIREFTKRRVPLLILDKFYRASKYGNRKLVYKLIKSPTFKYWLSNFSPNTLKSISLTVLYLTGILFPEGAKIIEKIIIQITAGTS